MATVRGAWDEVYEVADEPIVETTIAETPETPVEVTTEVTPTVVPETVETPAAEIVTEPVVVPDVIEAPIAEAPPTAAEIKEVIKIVKEYPEMDEFQSTILQYIQEGKISELGAFINESQRDYNTMSDYDVVKANLLKSNPNYTDEIAELKIEMQYGEVTKIDLSKLDKDSVDYAEAEEHNALVSRNLKMLKIDAIDARAALETTKKGITLPKIELPQVETKIPEKTPEAIEADRKNWVSLVEKELPEIKEFVYKVGDKDSGYEDVSFKVADNDRSELSTFLKDVNMQKMVARLGWVDDKGTQNIQKMAGDVLKLEKLSQIISSAYTQGKTTGTKGTVAEIKNLDLTGKAQSSVAETPPDIGLAAWGHINPK